MDILRQDALVDIQQHRPGNHIFELPDITGPIVFLQAQQGAAAETDLRGLVLNVSTGGACVLADKRSVEPFSVLPWRFQFPSVPVHVPVLAQVRWIAPAPADARHVRIGLSFLA